MALVECRECGSQISESAATCPRCGVSAPAGVCSLTFVRSGFVGVAVGVEVFVDGQPFGTIRGRGRVVVPVTPGRHHIEIRAKGKSTVGSVEASQGETVLNVAMSAMGSPKLQ
jgi:hypothetical protein